MTALTKAQTWLYHLGDINVARANEIAATNADLVVTEWASYAKGETPYTSNMLDRMRGGDDKLIVSYLSIGEAETYRYYWKNRWEKTPPSWIDDANPEWIDNVKVRYWDTDWQKIVFDYARHIVDAGFDGLYLDLVSAYEYWEDRAPRSGIDYRGEMADFVAKLETKMERYLDRVDPDRDFVLIGQNGLELIADPDYLGAIDGVAKEDLRFYYEYGSPQDFETVARGEYRYHLDLLEQAEAAGKATFVVEYVPSRHAAMANGPLSREAEDLGKAGTPIYVATHRDLDSIAKQPNAVKNGVFPPLGDAALRGTASADTIRGSEADDRILGFGGDDRLLGGAGRDELVGGRGLDELLGQAGRDILDGGRKADLLKGGAGNDALAGGNGADELFGGKGADKLKGGAGGDLLSGGNGADVFIFRPGSGEDEITDLDMTRDRIDLPKGAKAALHSLKAGAYLEIDTGDGVLLRGIEATEFDSTILI